MARKAAVTDFTVDVPEVGRFTFGMRKLGDELEVQKHYSRTLDGDEHPTEWLSTLAGWLATLTVMTVRAPEGWDIEGMDPTDQETYARLAQVYTAFVEKERSFRREQKLGRQAGSEATL